MKQLIIIVACSLLFSACYYDDDGSRIYLEIQDALIFENNQNYVVGDTLFFELIFSRYLDEDGFANKLDIFESSGSDFFNYDFRLNKFSEQAGGFRRIDVAEQFIFSEKGKSTGFGNVTAELNQDNTIYESRIGLILAETGRFELDLSYLYIRSGGYFDDKIQIDIEHTFTGDPPNFEFMVTE